MLLFNATADGAPHNSQERFPPPRCHPDTRVAILHEITTWAEGHGGALWLRGPAGAGKSAIAQTVAERCVEEGRLVASFFFYREDPKRNHGKNLWATLAAQMYTMIPEIRPHLVQIIDDNPLIFSQSADIQCRKLIVEPLQALAPGVANVIIIIDGLDECQDPRTQNEILLLIGGTLRTFPLLPAQFLIASRPEPNIQTTFDHPDLRQITRRIVLDDSYNSRCDIRTYLRAGFTDIHKKHESMLATTEPWPLDWILDLLADRSSGQFVYASTVLKFVGDENFLPVRRLEAVISISDARALSDLDTLYHQILSTCHPDNIALLQTILGIIHTARGFPSCEDIDALLCLDIGQTRLVLRGLHSLLSISNRSELEENAEKIKILHKSFTDFLQDQSRSGQFYIDVAAFNAWLARRCMQWIYESQDDILYRRLEGVKRLASLF